MYSEELFGKPSVNVPVGGGAPQQVTADPPPTRAHEPIVHQVAQPVNKWPFDLKDVLLIILCCVVSYTFVSGWIRAHQEDGDPKPVAKGLHVLVVYDQDPNADEPVTTDQLMALASPKVRDWLDANCKDSSGTKSWRMFQPGTDVSKDEPVWQKLMDKPRKKLPWLYMTGGRKEVSELMVDGGVDAFIKQLEKGK